MAFSSRPPHRRTILKNCENKHSQIITNWSEEKKSIGLHVPCDVSTSPNRLSYTFANTNKVVIEQFSPHRTIFCDNDTLIMHQVSFLSFSCSIEFMSITIIFLLSNLASDKISEMSIKIFMNFILTVELQNNVDF